jgi:hypothetical protein
MARHYSAIDSDPTLGRKRTADLLKRLRGATKDLRSLKSLVTELERRDTAAHVAIKMTRRRRES